MTKRFILTGAPGAGKTAVADHIRLLGHGVVEEAATSVIARAQAGGVEAPWERPEFIAEIAALQRAREAATSDIVFRFSDRSLFCTLALAEFLGHPIPEAILEEARVLASSRWFDGRVFFFEQLAFIVNTDARRITLEDGRRFGDVHAHIYRRFGFQLVSVPVATVAARANLVLSEAMKFAN